MPSIPPQITTPTSPTIPISNGQAMSNGQFDPSQLADIILPNAISHWPPALGWWLLLGILLLIIIIAIYLLNRKPNSMPTRRELKSQAMLELLSIKKQYDTYDATDNKSIHQTVKQLSIFLRRYALSLNSRENVASLSDQHWLTLLDNMFNQHLNTSQKKKLNLSTQQTPFSLKFSQLLTQVPYQPVSHIIDQALLNELFTTSELLINKTFKQFTGTDHVSL
jgi:hypothetical protein